MLVSAAHAIALMMSLALAHSAVRQDSFHERLNDDGLFLRLLCEDDLDSQHLLTEIGVVGTEAATVERVIETYKNAIAKSYLAESGQQSFEELSTRYAERMEQLQAHRRKALEELDQALLPHQSRRLRSVLAQRYLQSALGIEVFELPQIVLAKDLLAQSAAALQVATESRELLLQVPHEHLRNCYRIVASNVCHASR